MTTPTDRMSKDDLRAWRERLLFTQTQLAELLDVHYTTVQRWERGDISVPVVVVLALETVERRRAANLRERARGPRRAYTRRAAVAS